MAVAVVACCALSSCAASPTDVPVRSLAGDELAAPAIDAERAARLSAQTEEAAVWLGRRLAYEYRYREAVDVFSRGLEREPDSHVLLRHRGHRYITLRDFDLAVADLARAAELATGMPDEVEPDGAPNAYGIPRSTVQSNIHYHLGLAHYLRGEFGQAAEAWRDGLVYSRVNDDMLVATSWWLVLSLARAGDSAPPGLPTIDELLVPMHGQMDILENHGYLELLLMAKGERAVDDLLPDDVSDVASSTIAYGVAGWLLAQGEEARGLALCRRIVQGESWMAFGHIAAEAELHAHGER